MYNYKKNMKKLLKYLEIIRIWCYYWEYGFLLNYEGL